MDELEALFITLGMKPDDASVSASVKEMIQKLQQNLKSSVYGGKNGVITLPATIEGKFKNGKEINQEIKDAYAAIYEKAKQMADESVSLTLNDIKEFKAQIDKFGKKTAKYKGSDVIANANNNLRQTLSEYQTFINDLRKEASAIQKVQVKQNQKAKAQKKAKEKKSNYHGITDEEIDDAIAKENARQAKIKAWRDKQAEQLASRLGYKSSSPGPDPSRTNTYSLNASEFSEYESQWARELAKTIKETYRTTIDKQWIDKEYKPKTGAKSRATTREEYLNFLSNAAFGDLADLIAKAEKGDESVTFDQIVEAIGVMRTIYEENGKDMDTIAKAVTNAVQSRYDDNPRRKNAGVNREEGTEKGVGKGHERAQAYQSSVQQLLKKMLGEVDTIKQKEVEANKTAVKMTNAYEQAKSDAKTSKASADTKALAQEVKGEKTRDEKEYIQVVRESSREGTADTAEAQKNQQLIDETINNASTGTDSEAGKNEVIKAIKEPKEKKSKKNKTEQKKDINPEYLKNAITNPLAEGKCPCEEILKSIQKTLSAINGHTNAISKKLDKKKETKKKETKKKEPKKEPKKAEKKVEQTKTPEEIKDPIEALGINKDALAKLPKFMQDLFVKEQLGKASENFSKDLPAIIKGKETPKASQLETTKSISSNELLSRQLEKERTLATEKNKSKQVDNPKVMTTGENFNKLAPMIIDKFTAMSQGLGKAFGIIQKTETPFGKSPVVHNKTESKDPTMERLPAFIQKILQENRPKIDDLPDWAKTQRASEAQAQTIKDEEEARKRLADQIALETKMAKQRNAKKQRPKTQATIELGPEAGKEVGNSLQDTLKKIFSKITGESEASRIMNMSERERAKETAERMRKYGKPRGRGEAGDRGVISDIRYSKNYWRGKDAASGPDDPLYRDIRKTDPVDGIDVDKVMEALQKAIENNMFNAQTGGGWKAAMAASLTGGLAYAFQPSMEKTRAEIDGLNQVMANIRNEVLKILEDIQGKQAVLGEMQENGDIEFDDQGRPISGTPEAIALFNELENSKDILDSLLAEMGNMDQVIKECGGDVGKIIKKLGFVAPELRKENVILKNIGAGLDKNGKALKYQTRMGEVLNYSFQLMARHIGQMVKNWVMMMNPINLLKRAFADFASYDVKWQRTLNVIKYNLRRIIKPAMEWIAQRIVNIIGLVNALIKGIGKVFNQNWDLFDKAAAATEQMHEELEAAANVTASFDELHDIGGESSNNAAMDFSGDIYTPQWGNLYKKIEDFGKKIGDVLKGIHDLTEGWSFWKWLAIAGAALLGLMALKWLINLFSGKNPLKSVADGFSFLEKAVGWALLIWAFTEFTKALTDFVECMKTANLGVIAKSLIMLGGAFAILVTSVVMLEKFTKNFGTTTDQLLGLAAIVWVFGEFVKAVIPFIECIKDIAHEFGLASILVIGEAIGALVGAFASLVAAVYGLEKFTDKFGTVTGDLFGLAALVYVFGTFVKAVTPFIQCIADLAREFKLGSVGIIIEAIFGLVGAFAALVAGVGGLEWVTGKLDTTGATLISLSTVVGALSLFVKAITPFLEVIGELGEERWGSIIGMIVGLVGAFLALAGGVGAISRTFKAMDWNSILQLYAVAGVFEVFTLALIPFIKAIKDTPFETLAGGALLIAGAFISLSIALGIISNAWKGMNIGAFAELATVIAEFAGIIWVLEGFVKALEGLTAEQILAGTGLIAGTFLTMATSLVLLSNAFKQIPLGAFAEMLVLIAAMAGIIWVIAEFAKALKDISNEQLLAGLALLAGTIIVLAAAVGILAAVFTAVVTTVIGAVAIVLLAIILGVLVAIIHAMAEFVRALGEAGEGIKLILEGISMVVESIMNGIVSVITAIGEVLISIITAIADGINTIVTGIAVAIATIVTAIADGIRNVLQPILDFVDSVIDKVTELATTIVHEIGETIRTIIETVGNIILGIIDSITNAIPNLLNAILNFISGIGPAIENTADSIMRTITKVVNFTVSAIEYLVNLVVDGVNGIISAVNSVSQYVGINIPRVPKVTIQRFVPQYEVGTNYVPNDGLAYLHQGEAVIPKKYNQPYQPADNAKLENAINQLNQQVAQIGNKVNEGIAVKGQFIQKGSDLVATVEKASNKSSNQILNNKVYAR